MKALILHRLRNESGPVSGEALSGALGTSRVSIWKHIRRLQELGYAIEAGPRGYRLTDSPDTPFPWEFPGREERIHYYPEVDSTMEPAREMARAGCPELTVVVAGRQRCGRGRMQRSWFSETGGLYFTLVLRPRIPLMVSARINFHTVATLTRLLIERYAVAARVKWPNDILVGERKLCGMLTEMESEGDLVSFANVGIGLNVNNDPVKDEPNAVSLCTLTGGPVDRRELLTAFLDRLEASLPEAGSEHAIHEWKRLTVTLGRHVRVVTQQGTIAGRAVDVDPTGALILLQPDGSRRTVTYGDCFHAPAPPPPASNAERAAPRTPEQ